MRNRMLLYLMLLLCLSGCRLERQPEWNKETVYFRQLTWEEQMLLAKSGLPKEEGGRLTPEQQYTLGSTHDLLAYLHAGYGVPFCALYYHADPESGRETLYAVPEDTPKGTLEAHRTLTADGTWEYGSTFDQTRKEAWPGSDSEN